MRSSVYFAIATLGFACKPSPATTPAPARVPPAHDDAAPGPSNPTATAPRPDDPPTESVDSGPVGEGHLVLCVYAWAEQPFATAPGVIFGCPSGPPVLPQRLRPCRLERSAVEGKVVVAKSIAYDGAGRLSRVVRVVGTPPEGYAFRYDAGVLVEVRSTVPRKPHEIVTVLHRREEPDGTVVIDHRSGSRQAVGPTFRAVLRTTEQGTVSSYDAMTFKGDAPPPDTKVTTARFRMGGPRLLERPGPGGFRNIWSADGRLVRVRFETAEAAYRYDEQGRPISHTFSGPRGASAHVRIVYDCGGN